MTAAEPATVPKIFGAMTAVMTEITAVDKDKVNQQQRFHYRGIDDVYNALNPLLARNGIFMTSRILEKSRGERPSKANGVLAFTCLRIEYTFWAQDGSSVITIVEGEGMDSADKSTNKAMAAAHKYALLQAFCIPTKDLNDPDADAPEPAYTPAPRRQTAPVHPETGEVSPHQIPVLSTADGKGSDWMAWCRSMVAAIQTSRTQTELDAWVRLNDPSIRTVADENGQYYDRLQERIQQRQALLMQAPQLPPPATEGAPEPAVLAAG